MEQRTPEWFAARCGKVTASRIADLRAKTKTGWGASRDRYMAQLVVERITGTVAPSFQNAAMQWGTETEPQARAAYEFEEDATVVEVGFVDHPSIPMAGASPDGMVGDDGLIEIKCPESHTHLDTLLSEKIPEKYVQQMLWQMACTKKRFCDFVSFDPRMPPHLQYWCKRVHADQEAIAAIEKDVVEFLEAVNEKVEKLNERFPTGEAA
jgi:putative phage-type endonuclease